MGLLENLMGQRNFHMHLRAKLLIYFYSWGPTGIVVWAHPNIIPQFRHLELFGRETLMANSFINVVNSCFDMKPPMELFNMLKSIT